MSFDENKESLDNAIVHLTRGMDSIMASDASDFKTPEMPFAENPKADRKQDGDPMKGRVEASSS